jgi:isocitrate/isopropylmalate dehydrogenase
MTNQYLTRTTITREIRVTEAMIEAARRRSEEADAALNAAMDSGVWPDMARTEQRALNLARLRALGTYTNLRDDYERQQREIADGTLVPETEATE